MKTLFVAALVASFSASSAFAGIQNLDEQRIVNTHPPVRKDGEAI